MKYYLATDMWCQLRVVGCLENIQGNHSKDRYLLLGDEHECSLEELEKAKIRIMGEIDLEEVVAIID